MKGTRASRSQPDLNTPSLVGKKASPKKLRFSNNVICEYEVPSTRAGTEAKATPTPLKQTAKKQQQDLFLMTISPLPPRSSSFTESEVESNRLKIDKENANLRPLLHKYRNVEESVRTLSMHDVNYQIVAEDPPTRVSTLQISHLFRRTTSSKGGWTARPPRPPSTNSRSTATSTSTQAAKTLARPTK